MYLWSCSICQLISTPAKFESGHAGGWGFLSVKMGTFSASIITSLSPFCSSFHLKEYVPIFPLLVGEKLIKLHFSDAVTWHTHTAAWAPPCLQPADFQPRMHYAATVRTTWRSQAATLGMGLTFALIFGGLKSRLLTRFSRKRATSVLGNS